MKQGVTNHRFSTVHRIAMMLTMVATYWMLLAMDVASGDDSGNGSKACPMEMTFHTSFDTCYDNSTIATATVYADGLCHTVETNLSPSDANYSILPGNYRVECTSDGKLKFMASACAEGTCSVDATCSSTEALAGSLFERVQGQLVQDPSVGNDYICETLYDDAYEIFFAIFGDCSLPGCSVDGSVNPNPSEPTNSPISEPQPQPTRSPILATNAPQETTTPVPIAIPSTAKPQTLAPIENAPPTLSPITSSPVEMPTITAPVTVTLKPTAAPIIAPVQIVSPTLFPIVMPIETTTPTASPVDESNPMSSPIKNVRSPSPIKQPSPSTPTSSVTQSSSSDNNVVVLGAIGGSVSVIVLILLLFFVRNQCRHCKSVDSKNGVLSTSASSKETKELQLAHDLQNHDRLRATTATNEIWFDPNRDDVSTLDGGTMHDMALGAAGDEPTASVNMDFDYNKNQFRSAATVDERSRFTSSTNPTAFTTLSKLGMRSATSSLFDRNNDEQSFDQQFADMDDEEIMTAVGSMNWSRATRSNNNKDAANANVALIMNDIANRVRPFEVTVPPGMLGLVIDSPNGSVPVIRAIKPSSVLYPQVQVGDRLISVDHQNVTNMSATQVSLLITQKQNHNRVFVFCRLMSESQQNSWPIFHWQSINSIS